jgi:guanyl-specific ribonuclease Sa
VDALATLIPFVPAGSTKIIRAGKKAEKVGEDILRNPEVKNTLERIVKGKGKYPKDGTVFENREGFLPKKQDGNYYQEWTVDTPGIK